MTTPEELAYQLGYREIHLVHNDKRTGFKKIVKIDPNIPNDKGEFVWIARDGYHLLPNEFVQEAVETIAKEIRAEKRRPQRYHLGKWQYVAYYAVKTEDAITGNPIEVGFAVLNSMNASLVFDVPSFATINGIGIITGSSYRHRHTKNLVTNPVELKKTVESAIQASVDWIRHTRAFVKTTPREWTHVMEYLSEKLPRKYLPSYLNKHTLPGGVLNPNLWPKTMWDVYKDLVSAVWLSNVQEKTKILLFEEIHGQFQMIKVVAAVIR